MAERVTTRALAPGEQLEDGVLAGGQIDDRVAVADDARARVDDDRPGDELVDRIGRGAADEGADAGEELGQRERLGHVVVGAGVETADLVVDAVARRENQHRRADCRVRAAPRAPRSPLRPRQHDVEQDRVVGHGAGLVERRGAVRRPVDGVALLDERLPQRPREVRLIFRDENPHLPSLCSSCRRPGEIVEVRDGIAGAPQADPAAFVEGAVARPQHADAAEIDADVLVLLHDAQRVPRGRVELEVVLAFDAGAVAGRSRDRARCPGDRDPAAPGNSCPHPAPARRSRPSAGLRRAGCAPTPTRSGGAARRRGSRARTRRGRASPRWARKPLARSRSTIQRALATICRTTWKVKPAGGRPRPRRRTCARCPTRRPPPRSAASARGRETRESRWPVVMAGARIVARRGASSSVLHVATARIAAHAPTRHLRSSWWRRSPPASATRPASPRRPDNASAAASSSSDGPAQLKVFLDCDGLLRRLPADREIEFVDYVRDRTEAEVHVLDHARADRQPAGCEYTLRVHRPRPLRRMSPRRSRP